MAPPSGGDTIQPAPTPVHPGGNGDEIQPTPTPVSGPTPPVTPQVGGTSATWNATPTNANWVPGATDVNWASAGNFPGLTSGTTNTNTATFLTSNTTSIVINSATLNIKNITFGSGTVAPSNFTIGTTAGNSLLLTSAGEIAIPGLPNGTTNVIETVNAPLVLEPLTTTTAGTYGFRNSSSSVTNSLNIGGAISGGTTSAGVTLTLNGTNNGANTVSGVISDGGAAGGVAVSASGSGTWTLSGANQYTGGTTVSGVGTLLVSNTTGSGTGTGNVTVNGVGTTLGGTGTISGTVTLGNTTPGAILNPGPKGTAGTAASVGTLTTGALTLTGANTVHIDAFGIATNQWDKLVSTGAISLGTTSTLGVTIASGLSFTPGATYVLLDGTSLSGTFSGIADNQAVTFSGYAFTADYTATGFDLIAVPEPSTWVGAALAMSAVLVSQRRRFSRLLKHA